MRIALFFSLCLLAMSLSAQDLPLSVSTAIEAYDLEWPLLQEPESRVKFYVPDSVLNQSFDMGIHVPRENYRVLIYFEAAVEPQIPHIKATLKANHFARNDDETYVAIHTLTTQGLEKYGADWGGIYYFKPKLALPAYQESQLVCLYKTDVGAVYLLYLFDEFVPGVEEMKWNPIFRNLNRTE